MNHTQTALVTGASSGIGRALAVELAARGFRVGVTARRGNLLEELVVEVRATGGTIAAVVADVGSLDSLQSAIAELERILGPIDIAIANAGVGLPSGATPASLPAVEEMVRVNFMGVCHTFALVMRGMQTRGHGKLVAISSLAAYKGLPGSAGYCATKAAVNSYCEALRIELRNQNIQVTCICPGFIRTAMTDKNKEPMPFLMEPDEAARRILRAIDRKRKTYDFPWPMKCILKLAAWAPDWLIARNVRPSAKRKR